jgi:hypothetical protein
MFVSDTLCWCGMSAEMLVTCVCMYAFIFRAIDSNDECAEEGEVFGYQEEGDQGQANQGKPSNLMHI